MTTKTTRIYIDARRDGMARISTEDNEVVTGWINDHHAEEIVRAVNAHDDLVATLEQIARLGMEADRQLVDVPTMLAEIARAALAQATVKKKMISSIEANTQRHYSMKANPHDDLVQAVDKMLRNSFTRGADHTAWRMIYAEDLRAVRQALDVCKNISLTKAEAVAS